MHEITGAHDGQLWCALASVAVLNSHVQDNHIRHYTPNSTYPRESLQGLL